MDGYDADGTQDGDFAGPDPGFQAVYGHNGNFGSQFAYGSSYDNDSVRRTRDFLSIPSSFDEDGSYNSFADVPQVFQSSTNPTPTQLGLHALHINDGTSWANMGGYGSVLQSGLEEGRIGGSRRSPFVLRSGRGTLSFRPPSRGGSMGGGPSAGGQPANPVDVLNPALPVGRRGPPGFAGGSGGGGACCRLPLLVVDDDDDEVPPAQVPNRHDRGSWTPLNTKIFCEIYCNQIENGNCKGGNMNKWGWKEVIERFYAATNLVYDNVIFGNRVRQLKALWGFIQKLCYKCTGLGRREDGSVIASNDRWNENTQGHPDWKKLMDGWPDYLPEMDRMFQGVTADGSGAYNPKQPRYNISSDDDEQLTPLSIGSKRSSSSRSTATSPCKRSRTPGSRYRAINNSVGVSGLGGPKHDE